MLKRSVFRREDIELENCRGHKLKCSWFTPQNDNREALPCVIYCHGNCGSRCDCFEILEPLLTNDLTIFALDFSGSGHSDGEFVSLGYYESWDLKVAVEYLRERMNVSDIVLWGRSMGAAASILYAATDPKITAMVLDSPFSSLKEACLNLASSYKFIPKGLINFAIKQLRNKIKQLAHFDIEEVSPADVVKNCKMPAVFIHAQTDNLVPPSHSKLLFESYPGPAYRVEVDGGHNTMRPTWVLTRISNFIKHIVYNCYDLSGDDSETRRGLLPDLKEEAKVRLDKHSIKV